MGGVNRTILLGAIGKHGVLVRYGTNGNPIASFTLAVTELGQDNREHLTLVPCEVWGRKAEAVGELEAGALVLFEGRIRRTKKGEQWELLVSGSEITPIVMPSSGSNN